MVLAWLAPRESGGGQLVYFNDFFIEATKTAFLGCDKTLDQNHSRREYPVKLILHFRNKNIMN